MGQQRNAIEKITEMRKSQSSGGFNLSSAAPTKMTKNVKVTPEQKARRDRLEDLRAKAHNPVDDFLI